MKNVLKNIVLIVALSAVILMIMGILLYEYIPNGEAISTPNIYETDTKTLKVLAQIESDNSKLGNGNLSSDGNVILKSYSITQTDLALYQAASSYVPGKSDPFSKPVVSTNEGQNSSSSAGSATSGNNSSSNSNNGNFNNSSNGSSSQNGSLFENRNKGSK